MRASEIIRTNLDQIVVEWADAARSEVRAAFDMRELALLGHLPGILQVLAESLESSQDRSEAPGLHAVHRLREGFDVQQVIHEYRVLRRVLSRRVGREVSEDERGKLDEAMDLAVAVAVARFSEARQRSLTIEVERSRLALEAAELGLWEWFPATGKLDWDDRTRDLFGVGDGPVTYEVFLSSLHRDDRGATEAILRQKIESDAFGDDFRAEYRTSRSSRWIASRGRVVERDAHRRATRMIGTVLDATTRKRVEQELREAAEFRERFIAIVSHDLRNPLSAIRMSAAKLSRSRELPQSLGQPVERIADNAERMGRMIGDLLDLTRGRLGRGMPIAPRRASLDVITAGVLDNMRLTRPTGSVILQARGNLGGFWDPDRLAQAFGNLIANAIDHGDPRAPVRVELQGEEEARVCVEVSNDGEPIAPEDLPHVFEAFRRGGAQAGSGLGLGLFIACEIAHAHGGDISATSTAEGTVFRITLPRGAP